MHILICNERLLFRFGVDRVLLLLGQHFKERGHTVSFMANQYDRDIVEAISPHLIDVPTDTVDYLQLNEWTVTWLERTWARHFQHSTPPDVVIVGGWPFFAAIPFFRQVGTPVVFIDCGAVPLTKYSGSALMIQEKVRALRRQYLPETSVIVAISDFLARSQSGPDSGGQVPVKSILLAADHLQQALWSATDLHFRARPGSALGTLRTLQQQNRKMLLCLGRWEPACYKNSEAAFDFLQQIIPTVPDCALLILDEPSRVTVPPALQSFIFPIGFPDDAELRELMSQIDLGLSFSLWEGFNLPLAEMQWLGRPVLTFNVAAHPEVILHPWYLCQDMTEMVEKARALFRGQDLELETRSRAFATFHQYFTWGRVVDEYLSLLQNLVPDKSHGTKRRRREEGTQHQTVIMDVTNATKDPANSGVIRVTRRLGRELQRYRPPLFVVWDADLNCYVLPTEAEYLQLSQFNGPAVLPERVLSPDSQRIPLTALPEFSQRQAAWLLLTETVREDHAVHIRRFARSFGLRIAAIFYDAIPLLHPEFCNEEVRQNHTSYMRGLAECQVILPISHFSAQCLQEFWQQEGIPGSTIIPNELPGAFGTAARQTEVRTLAPGQEVKMLCVSTLEPRKNHPRLLRALSLVQEKFPTLQWSLTLVGNRYAGAFAIAEHVEAIAAQNSHIQWRGVVDDATLHELYEEATFTIYPSLVEGFGLPVLESMWHGRPCLCSRDGALGELAAGGGCLTTNVLDEQAMAEAIGRLATDSSLYARLAREAISRPVKTWQEYTRTLIETLQSQDSAGTVSLSTVPAPSAVPAGQRLTWQEILYPQCLRGNWQMHESERMAMTAILARHRPQCAIEVGTYQGGSLSLLSQYAGSVFSIDIDPSIPQKFRFFPNVSFLTGPSSVILPLLLKELDEAGIPVDFILIDGDHSAAGVKADLACVLSYIPKKPLFVMLHDSFNPECRRGMSEVAWAQSPYVEWVDLDFIPGRIVEYGGTFQGELWGGLALAYLSPLPRTMPLEVQRSAETMFKIIREYAEHNSEHTS